MSFRILEPFEGLWRERGSFSLGKTFTQHVQSCYSGRNCPRKRFSSKNSPLGSDLIPTSPISTYFHHASAVLLVQFSLKKMARVVVAVICCSCCAMMSPSVVSDFWFLCERWRYVCTCRVLCIHVKCGACVTNCKSSVDIQGENPAFSK